MITICSIGGGSSLFTGGGSKPRPELKKTYRTKFAWDVPAFIAASLGRRTLDCDDRDQGRMLYSSERAAGL